MRPAAVFRVAAAVVAFVASTLVSASSAGAANEPFSVSQHNIKYIEYDRVLSVAAQDRPLAFGVQEVCLNQLFQITTLVAPYGYGGRNIQVHAAAPDCVGHGGKMYNAVYTQAVNLCSGNTCPPANTYPTNLLDPAWLNEKRGYVCVNGSFGYQWTVCSTHLTVKQSYAYLQSAHLKNVLAGVSNWQVKLITGDFNLRPKPYGISNGEYTFGLDHIYESYREADQGYYNMGQHRSTRNPPGSWPADQRKIDYVFADRFWTLDAFGVQDRRCNTDSDHCLIIGTFRWG
jgi:endonuclease/exonuclease/phosphatase family metal-dependent hydrolase